MSDPRSAAALPVVFAVQPSDADGAEPHVAIQPLFVSVTGAMTLTDRDGREA